MRQSKKDIIYIPAPNSTCSKNWLDHKLKHAEAIISVLQQVHGGERCEEDGTGLIIFKGNGKPDFKIVNLVDEVRQKRGKDYLNRVKIVMIWMRS